MATSKKITETLDLIKNTIGLDLHNSSDIKTHNKKKYFNVNLDTPVFCSKEYDLLIKFANKYKKIYVEPNGVKTIAIFIVQKFNNIKN